MNVKRVVARVGWGTVVFLALLGMTGAVGRAMNWIDVTSIGLYDSVSEQTVRSFEGRYDVHPILTLIHILPGFVVMALGPLQFLPRIRARHIQVHRWSGRILVVAALVAAVSALVVTFVLPVFGGVTAPVSGVFFGSIFLFALVKAFLHVRRREIARHREWMIRAFGLALGISTFRVLLGVFLIVGVPLREAWDTVIWLGFALNMVVAEVWINVTRPVRREALATQSS